MNPFHLLPLCLPCLANCLWIARPAGYSGTLKALPCGSSELVEHWKVSLPPALRPLVGAKLVANWKFPQQRRSKRLDAGSSGNRLAVSHCIVTHLFTCWWKAAGLFELMLQNSSSCDMWLLTNGRIVSRMQFMSWRCQKSNFCWHGWLEESHEITSSKL